MNTYRARPLEVQAIDCGDGRHVLLTEPPRYMPTADFLEAFDLVELPEAGRRRLQATNGKAKGKRGGKRLKRPRRRQSGEEKGATPTTNGRRHSDERIMGLELWNAGNEVPTIAKTIGKAPSLVHYWRKKDKWPDRKKAAAPQPPAARPAVTTVRSPARKDDGWME